MARVISLDKWDVMIISPLNRFVESVLLIIFETSSSPVESFFNIFTTTTVIWFCMSYLWLSNDEFVSVPNALFNVLFAKAWVWVGGIDVEIRWDYCTSLTSTLDQLRVMLPLTLLQKDVRTGCPGTHFEALVRLVVLYNLSSWEFFLKYLSYLPLLLSYRKAFIVSRV